MSSVKINLQNLKEKKTTERKARLKHSLFFITINSNKRFEQINSDAEAIATKLSNFVATQFDNKEAFQNLLCTDKEGNTENLEIQEIGEFDGEIEVSSYTKCLHLHGMVHVSYRNSLMLNLPLLREKMLKFFGEKYHLDVIKVNDTAKTMAEYARKNPARFEKIMKK